MSDIDELPSWEGRAVQPGAVGSGGVPETPLPPPPPARRRRWPLALLAILLLAVIGVGAFALSSRDDGSPVASDGSASTPTIQSGTASTGTGAGGTQVSTGGSASTTVTTAPATATTATTAPPSSAATAPANPTPPKGTVTAENPEGALRWAIFKGGQVHLRGYVPAAAVGKEIESRAGKILGPPNVFNEYQIDPTVPIETPAPIYVEDVVLFPFNGVTIDPQFTPILDLGVKLMTVSPTAKVKVVATTDATGSPEANLRVSQQRAQAVINYWVRKGIDPARLTADPRGEQGSTATDDPQTAALRRRAEFIITGFLG